MIRTLERLHPRTLNFAVCFACAAGAGALPLDPGPARTAPKGLVPLESLPRLRAGLVRSKPFLRGLRPAIRTAGRSGRIGKFLGAWVYGNAAARTIAPIVRAAVFPLLRPRYPEANVFPRALPSAAPPRAPACRDLQLPRRPPSAKFGKFFYFSSWQMGKSML